MSMTTNLPLNVDRRSPQPLFEQIQEAITDWIESGRLKENDPIPSERDLSEMFAVNRLTARRAIDKLVEEGTLFRHQGKGTFVSSPKLMQPLLVVRSFTEAMLQEGRTPGTQVHSISVMPGRMGICRRLNIPDLEPVVELIRVRSVDGVPIARIASYLPQALLAGIALDELAASVSLYSVLRERCGLRLMHSRVTLEPVVANYTEAAQLGVQPGRPLMLLRGLVFTNTGQVAEYCKAAYRGDRVRFAVESQLSPETEQATWPNSWP